MYGRGRPFKRGQWLITDTREVNAGVQGANKRVCGLHRARWAREREQSWTFEFELPEASGAVRPDLGRGTAGRAAESSFRVAATGMRSVCGCTW